MMSCFRWRFTEITNILLILLITDFNFIIIVFNHILNVFNHILTKFNHILNKFNHILDYVVPMSQCIAPWWTPILRAAFQAWSRNWTWTLWCPHRTSPSSTSASSTSPTSAISLATRSSGRRRKSPPHLAYLTLHVVSMEEMHVHVLLYFNVLLYLESNCYVGFIST